MAIDFVIVSDLRRPLCPLHRGLGNLKSRFESARAG